jgi:uncharacterized membrane-anchored protein YhcB (DUF1043 family)
MRYISDFQPVTDPGFRDYLFVIIIFNLLSELLIILDNVMERIFPIPKKLKLRLILQSFLSIFILVLIYKAVPLVFPDKYGAPKSHFYLGIAVGLIFVTMLSTILLITRFTEKWIFVQQKIDKMEKEKLRIDYNALQDQLNPHFLFNNLSVLKSLIMYDTNGAIEFTENFTDVYRYVLQSKDKMLIELIDELKFIESFISLHKERIGEGFDVRFLVDKKVLEMLIAPLTLQLLIENAIKHNVASIEHPLLIEVFSENNCLIVKNNIQPKDTSYSTKTGLKNLIRRYELLDSDNVIVETDNECFMVKIPLL